MRPEGISFIVCCHNSGERLRPTLQHLAQQRPGGLPQELLLVDNASRDGSADLAQRIWREYAPGFPIRVVSEEQVGLNRARVRGIEESRHEYLVFVDDDNWLADDYGCRSANILGRDPRVGILGGCAEASFPSEVPSWFDACQDAYAVGPQGQADGEVDPARGYVYGAGLILRYAAWERLLGAGFGFLSQDRAGAVLSGGGDNELCMAARMAGYRVCYVSGLSLRHRMTEARLQWPYLLALASGSGASSVLDRCYRIVLDSRAATRGTCVALYTLELVRAALALAKRPAATVRYHRGRLPEGDIGAVVTTRLHSFLWSMWSCRARAWEDWFPRLLRLRDTLGRSQSPNLPEGVSV
jgi:GT2 family glycosyltransferase